MRKMENLRRIEKEKMNRLRVVPRKAMAEVSKIGNL